MAVAAKPIGKDGNLIARMTEKMTSNEPILCCFCDPCMPKKRWPVNSPKFLLGGIR